MSVESEILRIQHNIANAYAAVSDKGGEVPLQPTSENLSESVRSITSSGEIVAGDGLSKDGDTLSVDNPVRGIYTQEEFDDLTEEQKTSGTYFVGDGGNDAAKLLKIVSNGGFLGLPVCPQGPAGPDGNPIGTIISYMGLTAPKDYLICDGATYPIANHPDLADFFQAQFGSKNHFGGDGTITFAVPDMRNLFLRGYHGEAEEQLSDEIGAKQDATSIPAIEPAISSAGKFAVGSAFVSNTSSQTKIAKNYDTSVVPEIEYWSALTGSEPSRYENAGDIVSYTPRPVNMAVLYCIKAVESEYSGDIYSPEEQVVGRWIDGRPLYRKVFNGTSGATDGQHLILSGFFPASASIKTINGVLVDSNGASVHSGFYAANDGHRFNLLFYAGNLYDNVGGRSFFGRPFAGWIEYTKTTDPTPTQEVSA